MDYNKLEHYLSRPRLSRFLTVCGRSEERCLELYGANIRVSQAFYPVLNLFEVVFRNVCNLQLSRVFTNSNWIVTEKDRFMSDRSLKQSKFFLKKSVERAKRKILERRQPVTADKIAGELSFGFWTSFFDTHHFKLVKGCVIHAFPHKPKHVDRKTLDAKLTRVREFRNRVYHNEPVCFEEMNANFSNAENVRRDIYELLEWINPELPVYVGSFDTINHNINSFIAKQDGR